MLNRQKRANGVPVFEGVCRDGFKIHCEGSVKATGQHTISCTWYGQTVTSDKGGLTVGCPTENNYRHEWFDCEPGTNGGVYCVHGED